MPVTGIGGLFFRAQNPKELRQWYREHLGVAPEGYTPWEQAAGPTLVMPFAADTDHFPADKQWMVNFRVSDRDEMVAALAQAGIATTTDPAWDSPETGRFARLYDPEGNAIELWEPPLD